MLSNLATQAIYAQPFIKEMTNSSCPSDTSLIKSAEGLELCTYTDTTGHPTICYGYNLDNGSASSDIAAVGGNYNDVINGGCLTKSQCSDLLTPQVNIARNCEKDIYGNKISCACAKNVLVDMCYNLGEGGLSGFYTFNSLMEQGEWDEAANDLETQTLWCSQVGTRCTRDADIIRGCDSNSITEQIVEEVNEIDNSKYCHEDMNNLEYHAKVNSQGKYPDGRCYSHVADYIDAVGYGGIAKGGFNDAIPPEYWAEAHDFADYLNQGDNAAQLSLKNIMGSCGNNPYNAPDGAIVVVAAGAPGTSNPTAGDIAVAAEGDSFWNGGDMSYGPKSSFPTKYTLGIYVPTKCSSSFNAAFPEFAQ